MRQSSAPRAPASGVPEWPSASRYARHLEAFYGAITGAYDDWSSGIHRRHAARLVELAGAIPGERVLDIGCGTGLAAQMAAERVGPAGEVIGVDIARRLLEFAASRASPPVRFLHCPAEALLFSDLTFDLATLSDALAYLSDPWQALREAHRVLRRGARIAVSVLDRSLSTPAQEVFHDLLVALERRHPVVVPRPPGNRARFGEPEVLTRMLRAAGFTDVATTVMVTGGRACDARRWTELMMGAGPSSHALLSVLGPSVRERFETELSGQMAGLGEDEAFRYHHAVTFAVAIRP